MSANSPSPQHPTTATGFSLARKVQANFARAVELNPLSLPALNDLGEYYISAPSIVGGGVDKAQALAQRMMPTYPPAAHRMLALIAEQNKDLPTAEAEFKTAVAMQKSAEAWVDLAHFYQKHDRNDDALAAAQSAIAADRARDAALVDVASILTAAHRAPDLAERSLRQYLASPAKSDAAPAFKVHLQLSKLLAQRGDKASAQNEVQAAQALASSFARNYRSPQGS
jgi:uncharacterized protein HemY